MKTPRGRYPAPDRSQDVQSTAAVPRPTARRGERWGKFAAEHRRGQAVDRRRWPMSVFHPEQSLAESAITLRWQSPHSGTTPTAEIDPERTLALALVPLDRPPNPGVSPGFRGGEPREWQSHDSVSARRLGGHRQTSRKSRRLRRSRRRAPSAAGSPGDHGHRQAYAAGIVESSPDDVGLSALFKQMQDVPQSAEYRATGNEQPDNSNRKQ
jgi:hypothetical protein